MEPRALDVERFADVLLTLLPVLPQVGPRRSWHVGALLADVALQAGVNYKHVVLPRVRAIEQRFAHDSTVSAVTDVVRDSSAEVFLQWYHPIKVQRFKALLCLCGDHGLETVEHISEWLKDVSAREQLLNIPGIGEKSVDYLAALCGHDVIAVDRHWWRLLALVGVRSHNYSYARGVIEMSCRVVGVPSARIDVGVWRLSQALG